MLAVTYCLQNSIRGTSGKGSVCVYVCVTDPVAKNQACLRVSGGVFLFMPAHLPCYSLNVCIPPPNSYVEILFPKMILSGGGSLGTV